MANQYYKLRRREYAMVLNPVNGDVIKIIESKPYYGIMYKENLIRLRIEPVNGDNKYEELIFRKIEDAIHKMQELCLMFGDDDFCIAEMFGTDEYDHLVIRNQKLLPNNETIELNKETKT